MSESKIHKLLCLLVASGLLVFLLLMALVPAIGVLWLVLFILCVAAVLKLKPGVWNAEKSHIRRRWNRLFGRLAGDKTENDMRPVDFAPGYELVSLSNGSSRYPINKESFLIGRGSKCDCVLYDAPTVGREHCRIIFRKYSQEYYIEDLRSANGTYLGTRRLEPFAQEKLLDHSEIIIGSYRFLFEKKEQ